MAFVDSGQAIVSTFISFVVYNSVVKKRNMEITANPRYVAFREAKIDEYILEFLTFCPPFFDPILNFFGSNSVCVGRLCGRLDHDSTKFKP